MILAADVRRVVDLMRDRARGGRPPTRLGSESTEVAGLLAANGLLGMVDQDDGNGMVDAHRASAWAVNAKALVTVNRIAGTLVGVDHAFTGGPLLIRDLHGDPFARASGGVGILVAPGTADEVAARLVEAGHVPEDESMPPYWRSFVDARVLPNGMTGMAPVEIREAVPHPAGHVPSLVADVLARRTTTRLGRVAAPVPNPDHAFLLRAARFLGCLAAGEPAGALALDLATMAGRMGPDDVTRIEALAATHRLATVSGLALWVSSDLLGRLAPTSAIRAGRLRMRLGGDRLWSRVLAPATIPVNRTACALAACDRARDAMASVARATSRRAAAKAHETGLLRPARDTPPPGHDDTATEGEPCPVHVPPFGLHSPWDPW